MEERRSHQALRMEAPNGRHHFAAGSGGSRSGSDETASLGAGLHPPGPTTGRRIYHQAFSEARPPSPVVAQQLVIQEQQQQQQLLHHQSKNSEQWRYNGPATQQQHHNQYASDGDSDEGLMQGNGTLHQPATPLAPPSPATMRRNSRLALLSMLLLVFQGTALSIMLRYSRARKGKAYLASVSVILTEVIKLIICLAMQLRGVRADMAATSAGGKTNGSSGGSGGQATVVAAAQRAAFWREVKRQARDIAAQSLPMLLPAAMFVMQQVLLIIAATHLDAVAFQIFSQSFKLVPTALFAYWLLGQMLEPVQWASIPVLAMGVILVTVNNGSSSTGSRSAAAAAVSSSSSGLGYVAGMVACSVSGLSSAYAGVYFEKYVKGRHAASLWVRNIQLGMYGVPLSTVYALVKDGARIRRGGLLQGFDAATWAVIALQVFGGLVTGMVVKYCDNVLKNFALAISVILTVLVAIPLFGQWPSPVFLLGVALVLLSVFMYGRAVDGRMVQLWWQRTLRRWLPQDPAARSRRLLAALLLASAGAGFVLILTGITTSRRLDTSLPLTRSARRMGQRGSRLTEADLALRMSQLGRSDEGPGRAERQAGSGHKRGGLRGKVGQMLKDGAAEQQLMADRGRHHRRS